MIPMNGQTPVPGPTIIIGVFPSGIVNMESLIKMLAKEVYKLYLPEASYL